MAFYNEHAVISSVGNPRKQQDVASVLCSVGKVETEVKTEPRSAVEKTSNCIQLAEKVYLAEETARLPTEDELASFHQVYENIESIRKADMVDETAQSEQKEPCCHSCGQRACCKQQTLLCNRAKLQSVPEGMKGVVRWWTDGLTGRGKLLAIVVRIIFSFVLLGVTCTKIRTGLTAFAYASITLSGIGSITAFVRWGIFGCRRTREALIAWLDLVVAAGKVLQRCCCCRGCKQGELNVGGDQQQASGKYLNKATEYVNRMREKAFLPPKTTCARARAFIGNSLEIILSFFDEVFGTALITTSLYSFIAEYYGTTAPKDWSYGFSLLQILLAFFKVLTFTHGSRVLSVAYNVYKMDKKLEEESEVLKLEKTHWCMKPFTFQWRLVFHLGALAVLQTFTLLSVMWRFIPNTCIEQMQAMNTTVAPDIVCDPRRPVDGYIIYIMVYVSLIQPFMANLSFLVCNALFFVEYMQLIAMRAYLQLEYMSGYTPMPAKASKSTSEECFTPPAQFLKVLTFDLLPDVSHDNAERRAYEVGKRANKLRRKIAEDMKEDGYGESSMVWRGVKKSAHSVLFLPSPMVALLSSLFFGIQCLFTGLLNFTNAELIPGLSSGEHLLFFQLPEFVAFLLTSFPAAWVAFLWIVLFPLLMIYLNYCTRPGGLTRALKPEAVRLNIEKVKLYSNM